MNSLLTEIKKVADQIRGVTYGADDAIDKPQNGYIGLLRANNIQNNCLNFDDLLYVPSHKVSSLQILKRGDILIAASSGSLSIVGKAGVFKSDEKYTFGAFCKAIRPRTNIDASYLSHYFFTTEYRTIISSLAAGANINNLRNEHIDNLSIPLPPLAEQQRIAALLDTADRILKQRQLAIAKLEQLAQSVFVDMFGNISNNNKKWPIHEFSKLADNEDYKRKPIKSSDRDNRGGAYPYYGASGIIDTIDEYIFEGDSLLIGEDGANLVARSSPIAFIARGKYWVNNHAHILRQNRNANIRYLEYFLLQIDLKPYVTGSAQPKLTRGNLDRILVPTPPIKLQNHFEKIIIELEAEKDVMNSNQRVALKLVSSIQHQSFAVN